MITGDECGSNLRLRETPEKQKPQPGNWPDRGSNPGPLCEKWRCYPRTTAMVETLCLFSRTRIRRKTIKLWELIRTFQNSTKAFRAESTMSDPLPFHRSSISTYLTHLSSSFNLLTRGIDWLIFLIAKKTHPTDISVWADQSFLVTCIPIVP